MVDSFCPFSTLNIYQCSTQTIHWCFWICRFTFFIKFVSLPAIISLNFTSALLPHFPVGHPQHICWPAWWCPTGSLGTGYFYIFLPIPQTRHRPLIHPQVHWYFHLFMQICWWAPLIFQYNYSIQLGRISISFLLKYLFLDILYLVICYYFLLVLQTWSFLALWLF